MMKKIVIAALVLVAVVGASHFEHNYTRDNCVVTEVTETGAIFEDRCGWTWYWEGEGFKVGDTADLKMHDNFTSAYIDDDIIKKVVKK